MAELNNFIKSLEKELTCSICEEIFTEPKQLHCLHSFCLKCIEKWNETCKNRRQRLTCPTCRSREDGDVSKLRSSFYLDSLTQLLLAMRNKAGKPDDKLQLPNCVSCQEHVKLVAFCQQCQGMICTDCVNAHKKLKQLRDQHQVIMFIDFKQEHVNSYISNQVHCQEKYHEKQKLEYFCQTCKKCICPKCSNTTHGTHEKLSIEEKADEMKRLINNSLHRVNQQKQRFVQELELSKQNMRRAENEIETAKKEVFHHVQAQLKILKDHQNAMTKTLDEILLEQKTANDEEQNEIIAVIQQLDGVNEQSKILQDQNVHYSILQSQLPNRCEEMMQTPSVLSSKPVKRNTSVYYTPNHQVTQSLQDIGKIEENVTDPSRCSIELQNEEIRCGFVNKLAIVTRNSYGDVCYTNKGSIDVQIKDEDGCEVEIKLVENQTGKYIVTYKAEKLSQYEILVNIAGNTIKNSPIKVRTLDAMKTNFKPVRIIGTQTDFNLPVSLEVNDNQEHAVVDFKDHRIVIFSKDGKCLHKFGGKGTRDGELYKPSGVVMYEDSIVISDYPDDKCGRIQEFDVNGAYRRTIYRQGGTEVLRMCTTGDNISVQSFCNIDDKWQIPIKLFSKHSGQFIRDIPISTVTRDKEEQPYYITYGNNKYFLSYPYNDYIGVYDDNGVFLYKFGDKGKAEGQFDFVRGLAVYGEEMLLACDGNNHRVQVFTQEGQYITSFGGYGSGVGQMNVPADVAVTPDGKVFVLERIGKRVQVWQ